MGEGSGPVVSLGLANATNARDLGGLATADGRVLRHGLLFRSNALHRLSPEDIAALDRLNLACLIDLRHEREIAMSGADRLPDRAPGQLVSLPLFDPEDDVFTKVTAAVTGQGSMEILERLHADHSSGGAPASMRQTYRWFVSSPTAREGFGAALRMIASGSALPLLFHCAAGKDRTGWLAALVLSTLGVPREVIFVDYLRTNELNAATNAFVLSRAAARIDDPSVLLPLLEARQEYLEQAFDEVDTAWGGLDAYLTDALNITPAARTALETLLLTTPA